MEQNDFKKFQDLTAYQRMDAFDRFKNRFTLDQMRVALFRFDIVNGKQEIAMMEVIG